MKKNKFVLGIAIMFSFVLVACGRDVSTVEQATVGHWTMTDARVNGEPLLEVIEQYDEFLDVEEGSLVESEEGQTELDVDIYRSEDQVMTIVNAEGEQAAFPYEVISRDEENGEVTLEYTFQEEEMDLRINEVITYIGEERETMQSRVNVVDAVFKDSGDTTTEPADIEEAWAQLGEEIVLELLRGLNFEFELDYVDDAEAPPVENQE